MADAPGGHHRQAAHRSGTAKDLLVVSFEDSRKEPAGSAPAKSGPGKTAKPDRAEELMLELSYTKENLQATIGEMQAGNEELKSTNEELQSINEELQSTNEELETSKEELQSVNEEIVTVNAELQAKIEQLTDIQNDMKNLLDSTSIGTIFLDENLVVKRFTKEAARVFRLVASDTGRPLADIKSTIVAGDIVADAQEVLDTMVPRENEVKTTTDLWYLARISLYRTFENAIGGVVITFTDITALKTLEAGMKKARDYAESIVSTVREPLLVLDHEFRVVSANRSFYTTFGANPAETVGASLFGIGNGQWDLPRLRELLETVLPGNTHFEDIGVDYALPGTGRRKILLNGRQVIGGTGEARLILLALEDVTSRPPSPRKGRNPG